MAHEGDILQAGMDMRSTVLCLLFVHAFLMMMTESKIKGIPASPNNIELVECPITTHRHRITYTIK